MAIDLIGLIPLHLGFLICSMGSMPTVTLTEKKFVLVIYVCVSLVAFIYIYTFIMLMIFCESGILTGHSVFFFCPMMSGDSAVWWKASDGWGDQCQSGSFTCFWHLGRQMAGGAHLRPLAGALVYGLSSVAVAGSQTAPMADGFSRACVPREPGRGSMAFRTWPEKSLSVFSCLPASHKQPRFKARQIRLPLSMWEWQGHPAEEHVGWETPWGVSLENNLFPH